MLIKPSPKQRRILLPIQSRDIHRSKYGGRRPSTSPEARDPKKHALNPPIVTIFGAGVAGLTAAHELVERGFLVQVLEAAEDGYCPGRPLVGGMAANQPARVRANVEDLHTDLLNDARRSSKQRPELEKRRVATWLLGLFTFNRSRWVQTELPGRLHTQLYSLPKRGKKTTTFANSIRDELSAMREQYRKRWCWDLIVRGVQLGSIKAGPGDVPWDMARDAYEELLALKEPLEMALWLQSFHAQQTTEPAQRRDVPNPQELRRNKEIIRLALEREFLCFRLVPYGRTGFEALARAEATELLREWGAYLRREFGESCVAPNPKQEKFAIEAGNAPAEFDKFAWLQIEVIEQRLPGEHGYRFFPSFYRHLDDTMRRIPLFDGDRPTGHSVSDNLVPTITQAIGMARDKLPNDYVDTTGKDGGAPARSTTQTRPDPVIVPLARKYPDSLEALRDQTERFVKRLGGTSKDAVLLTAKLLQFMTSSAERRRGKYEHESWGEFLKLDNFSETIQKQITSAAQALLSFSAAEADARTYGNVAIQLLLDGLGDGTRVDRTLNGPTSDAWLEPWREYLERQGVRFFCLKLEQLEQRKDSAGNVQLRPVYSTLREADPSANSVSQDGKRLLVDDEEFPGLSPDFYVLALSLEETARLLQPLELDVKRARDLVAIRSFADQVVKQGALKDMTGVQFFFDAKTSIGEGHMYYPYSDWGLSSISQSEFWSRRRGFADGYFGLLSVDICTTGTFQNPEEASFWATLKGKDAPHNRPSGEDDPAPRYDAARAVWKQLSPVIGQRDKLAAPRCYHLDRNISPTTGNATKFLASAVGLDEQRPGRPNRTSVGEHEIEYSLAYGRWAVCGTFMATHTRMTTMEAANESARHAIKPILRALETDDRVGSDTFDWKKTQIQIESLRNKTYNGADINRTYDEPDIWPLEERELRDLEFFKRIDRRLFNLGLPHFMEITDFERKLIHSLEAIELYGDRGRFRELLGAAFSGLDATLTNTVGVGYSEKAENHRADVISNVRRFQAQHSSGFKDMERLLDHFAKLLEAF